jgi:hypothetical protein
MSNHALSEASERIIVDVCAACGVLWLGRDTKHAQMCANHRYGWLFTIERAGAPDEHDEQARAAARQCLEP